MLKDLLAEGVRSRIAPTPSGYLHAGNGMNFILTWAITRAAGGQLLLRIDDLDRARYRPEYAEDTFESLEWLGLDYDEGPRNVKELETEWSQHLRLERYQRLLDQLRSDEQLFACQCSRKEIRAQSEDGRYPGTCRERNLPFDATNTAWRVKAPATGSKVELSDWRGGPEIHPLKTIDDFVVRQKNELPAYQIASLADDIYFGINLIVRGQDLWTSSLSQQYLAHLLRQEDFYDCHFFHHALIRNPSGEKMSKSAGDDALRNWRKERKPPAFLFQLAAPVLGLELGISDGPSLVAALQEQLAKN